MRFVAAALCLWLSPALAQDSPSWTPRLSVSVRTIGPVVPSPGGEWAAYTVTEAVIEEEKSERLTQIHLARADGARRVQLTRGEKSAADPSFSPDGKFVYFLSSRGGGSNIWRIAVGGGEAERVTDWKGRIGAHAISPDGELLAFTATPEDQEQETARKQKRDFRVIDANPEMLDLWILRIGKSAESNQRPKKLTAGYHIEELAWSPGSARIAVTRTPTGQADDGFLHGDVLEIDVAAGRARELAATQRREWSPRYSPDGKSLAFLHTQVPASYAGECRFVVLPLDGGSAEELAVTADECGRGTHLLGWRPDSKSLLYTETHGVRNVIRAISLDGEISDVFRPETGTLSSYGGNARLDASGRYLGFSLESANSAPEAYLAPATSAAAPVKLSDANPGPWPAIGEAKTIAWKSDGEWTIEGRVVLPVGYERGRRYPLVLLIHGGPMGVFTDTFLGGGDSSSTFYPVAAFAQRGYVVLMPNPRGSSGYGRKFRFANYGDWGGGDYRDIMAGVDRLIAEGIADPERMAVMGWSYGGYMTSWIIGQTGRFKAASAGAAVTNLWSFTGTADIPGFLPDYFSGEPWDAFEAYRKHSPMSYVGNATTPTLILHGESDDRVPITQSHELYNALKRRGVPTRMVVYPRQPHGPNEPKFVIDIAQRHLDWVEKYLGQ